MARVRGDEATGEMRKRAGGGKFLSLKDGDSYQVAFAGRLQHGAKGDKGEPMGAEVVWLSSRNGKRFSEEYDPANADHDEDEVKVTFFWSVVVRDDKGNCEARIFNQGARFYDEFVRLVVKKKNGVGYWFTIAREGSGQLDTEYHLDREDKFTEEELSMLKSFELHDLNKEAFQERDEEDEKPQQKGRNPRRGKRSADEAPRTSSGNNSHSSTAGNGTISDDQKNALKQALVNLKEVDGINESFQASFSIKRLKDLSSDKFDDAMTFLADIGRGEGDASSTVDDPFLD